MIAAATSATCGTKPFSRRVATGTIVAPAIVASDVKRRIEEALKRHPLINEAVVIGDRRKYLVTLLTLEPSLSAQWAQDHHIPLPDLPSHPLLKSCWFF